MDMELKKHGDEMRDKILNYIIQYISEHGYSPNYDEIREAVGLKSKSSVHNHVNKMFENGMIETDCGIGTPRAIRVPGYKFVKEEFATDINVWSNGQWNKKCKYNAIVAKTGEIVPVYECTCSVCGWKTGNQGMRFNYCPNCGAKMDEPYKPKGE